MRTFRKNYRGRPPYRPIGISTARRNFGKFCKRNRHINRFEALIFIKLQAMLVDSEHFLDVSAQIMRVGSSKTFSDTKKRKKHDFGPPQAEKMGVFGVFCTKFFRDQHIDRFGNFGKFLQKNRHIDRSIWRSTPVLSDDNEQCRITEHKAEDSERADLSR